MALRIVASRPDPAIVTLPWSTPLEEWSDEVVVPLARGLSRHVVRIVQLHDRVYAVKETREPIAFREYRMLRDLQRLGLPAVVPQGVVTGRVDADGNELEACLLTQHLRFSLPYRTLFRHGLTADRLPSVIDALVVLLVRLHLAGFFWGDVSLSNVLFRRSAAGFAAYLVDAETGELRDQLSTPMRAYDLTLACENVFAELLDLQASETAPSELPTFEIVDQLQQRYDQLWRELTAEEEIPVEEMWKVEARIRRLNDLGFDVDELDLVTDYERDTVRLQPRVVELGHHRRELLDLAGIDVEDAQAQRILNDIAAYTATRDLGGLPRDVVARRWRSEVYEPFLAMIPPEAYRKLEPSQMFHEILDHRWHLAEAAGHHVKLIDAARDYLAEDLRDRPVEDLAAQSE